MLSGERGGDGLEEKIENKTEESDWCHTQQHLLGDTKTINTTHIGPAWPTGQGYSAWLEAGDVDRL